ncbi:hypothetical protein QLS71_017635 [Mariniflexile litorale]|uniref:WG repeat protein n=1 Tax=Mariniflexile litorale TaxID=3045158 RepID=A0AAU7EG46_9FLAO|nr:hypothetical protein [Mariniflexile sp. KMM 9835]MDQ8213603.1 hypothetical protein [Mariniflexile sp. KMM 9835]
MKKTILLITCLLSIFSIYSQVNIGRKRGLGNLYVVEHNDKLYDIIKKTTTYFVVPDSLDFNETKKTIEEIWTFNSIKFISEVDYQKGELISTDNSIIKFQDKNYIKTKETIGRNDERIVGTIDLYKFQMFYYEEVSKKNNGKIKKEIGQIAEIIFTPDNYYRFLGKETGYTGDFEIGYVGKPSLFKSGTNEFTVKTKDDGNSYKYLKTPESYNFHLGYIKNYFQTLNNKLTDNESLKIRDEIKKKDKLKELKSKTLYVPNWLLKDYSTFKLKVTKVLKPEELFEDYKFEFKVLSNEELNSKILNKDEFYYLMHTTYNGEKVISIINSLTGEIIYSIVDNSSNLIEKSDLKDINKLIK